MRKPLTLVAERIKYDSPHDRHSPGHDCFVVLRIEGSGCTNDDFAVWEDLTPRQANFIVRKFNGEGKVIIKEVK